jgi:hypothetical protein
LEKVEDYILLEEEGAEALTEKIYEAIKEGYVPFGSPVITQAIEEQEVNGVVVSKRIYMLFAQAVVYINS